MAVTVNSSTFPDDIFSNYVLQEITGGSTTLTDAQINSTTGIYVEHKSISNLKGIEYFTKLVYLWCEYNNLTTLDVSKNTALTSLTCNENNLTSLDVSKNTALTTLWCHYNNLTSLDVSKNTALIALLCQGNNLTSIDVSKNTALTTLWCDGNNLTSLDVSKNTALSWLRCNSNNLTSLDVSKNTALTKLECSYQTRTNVSIATQSNTTYPFKYDIGTANNGKLASATVKGSDRSSISNTYSNGVLQFAARPKSISYSYTLKAGSATGNFDVTITAALVKATIPTTSLAVGYKNENYSLTLAAPTNGTYPMSLSVSGLPSGLSYNSSTRVISGTPSVTGSFNVTLKASNAAGDTTKTLTLTVYEKPTITTSSLPSGINGVAYSAQLSASGTATITYSATNLPTGLSCNTSGKISGTPTVTETKSVTITAKNSYGTTTKSLNLVINQKPVITTSGFNTTIPNIYYYAANSATGTTPYTWSATDLPEGLSIDVSTGVISGTPTVSGDFNIKLNVKNVAGSYEKTLAFHIEKLPEVIHLRRILSDPTYKYSADLSDYLRKDILKNIQNVKAKVLKTYESETDTVYNDGILKSQNLLELLECDYVIKYADNKTYTLHINTDLRIAEEEEIMPEDNYRDYATQLRSEVKAIVEYIKNAFVRV